MCCREDNHHMSHYVVVYVFLDDCKAYTPLVVVKGTPQNIYKYGEEGQHIIYQTRWHIWPFLHDMAGSYHLDTTEIDPTVGASSLTSTQNTGAKSTDEIGTWNTGR